MIELVIAAVVVATQPIPDEIIVALITACGVVAVAFITRWVTLKVEKNKQPVVDADAAKLTAETQVMIAKFVKEELSASYATNEQLNTAFEAFRREMGGKLDAAAHVFTAWFAQMLEAGLTPYTDPADIAILEDTLPVAARNPPRRTP